MQMMTGHTALGHLYRIVGSVHYAHALKVLPAKHSAIPLHQKLGKVPGDGRGVATCCLHNSFRLKSWLLQRRQTW